MIQVVSGLKNSLIILEHLRSNEALQDIYVTVGTFTNCREQGLTFAVTDGPLEKWFTFCVYEHRNSDEIIINGKKGLVSLNGELPYTEGDKWTYLASFAWNQHTEAARKLAEMLIEKANIGKTARIKEVAA